MATGTDNRKRREQEAAKAREKPLEPHQRELLGRLLRKGALSIGHTTATFSPRDRLHACTPAQARVFTIRGLAEIERPNPRGPRVLKPLPAAFKIALGLVLCLLLAACPAQPSPQGNQAVKTTSQGDSGGFSYDVIEVESGGSVHHVLVVTNRRGIATCKLCTTFEWDGKPYYVDSDGKAYEWRRLERNPD